MYLGDKAGVIGVYSLSHGAAAQGRQLRRALRQFRKQAAHLGLEIHRGGAGPGDLARHRRAGRADAARRECAADGGTTASAGQRRTPEAPEAPEVPVAPEAAPEVQEPPAEEQEAEKETEAGEEPDPPNAVAK